MAGVGSRALFGVLAIMPIAGGMLYLVMRSAAPGVKPGATPKTIIDSVAARHELVALAAAERQEFALEGKYDPDIEDLMKKSDFKFAPNDKAPYKYSAEVTPTGFRVIATYAGPRNFGAPTAISIDETMGIKIEYGR